jgi:hypothetical protein
MPGIEAGARIWGFFDDINDRVRVAVPASSFMVGPHGTARQGSRNKLSSNRSLDCAQASFNQIG